MRLVTERVHKVAISNIRALDEGAVLFDMFEKTSAQLSDEIKFAIEPPRIHQLQGALQMLDLIICELGRRE